MKEKERAVGGAPVIGHGGCSWPTYANRVD